MCYYHYYQVAETQKEQDFLWERFLEQFPLHYRNSEIYLFI